MSFVFNSKYFIIIKDIIMKMLTNIFFETGKFETHICFYYMITYIIMKEIIFLNYIKS